MPASLPAPDTRTDPLFIADNLALDFVNTTFGVGAGHQECLGSDVQVLDWLRCAGLPAPPGKRGRSGALLSAAHELRSTAVQLITARKRGRISETSVLNRILAAGSAYSQLVWTQPEKPVLRLHNRLERIESLLVPVAQAVASLLTEGDFRLVRQCEGSECVLWFYDHTKAHKRRWCSMALCGNRMKVAAFRARQRHLVPG
ncbi:MAG TPA: ABATE domain-containing protein [Steroidobacteraceae bacterium]|nr:ABATE domain-containing protein [Steroidobacteraceae bacterium]